MHQSRGLDQAAGDEEKQRRVGEADPNSVQEWLPLGAVGEDRLHGGVNLPENVTWSSNIACEVPSLCHTG